MTQVISAYTPDCVVLVADRRLIDLRSGALIDDEACKVIALGSQVALGFTGLANLKPPPRGQTDLWLADLLSPPPPTLPEIFGSLLSGAEQTFSKITHLGPRAKRHSFVAIGWQAHEGGHCFLPFLLTISNAEKSDGEWLVRSRPDFQPLLHPTRDEVGIHVTGQPLQPRNERELHAALHRSENRRPEMVAALLGTAIRKTASENRAVGGGLLGVVLPRETVSSESGFQLHGAMAFDTQLVLPRIDGPTAFYVPSTSNTETLHAPHLITPSMMLADVKIHNRALSEEEIKQDYEEGLLKRR